MITLYRYVLPFVRPVAIRGGTLATRTGLLVRVSDAQGRSVWGEAAPWPGLSRESLDAASVELNLWRAHQEGGRGFALRCAAAAFAVESAAEMSAAGRVAAPALATKVPINALLSDEPLEAALQAVHAAGFRTLKLKVGRQSIQADAERVLEVRRQVGPDMKVRLDANRAWTLAGALDFARRITSVQIEYIEEPLQNPVELPLFHDHTGLPVALDEALLEQPLDAYRSWRGVRAAILKPTILGGLRAAARLAAQATELGWLPVFSAVYESGVGIRALARLAARCGAPGVAMGFDTYRCLADDVLEPRLILRDGALDLQEAGRAKVCLDKLQVLP